MMIKEHKVYMCSFLSAVVMMVGCSSDGTLEEEHVVEIRTPMEFGYSYASEAASTRAASPLEGMFNTFKVGVWKNFGNAEQQIVMDGYKVENTAATKWNYVDVIVGDTKQIQRYWDLSAYPYEFRAVSPYLPGASLAADKITLDVSATPFKAQTLVNDVLSAAGEPCVVAHVDRRKVVSDYVDRDLIKNEAINTASMGVPTREVRMPFHHLVSKVGFRIFIDDPQPEVKDYRVDLKSITISVVTSNNDFIYESKTYTANATTGLGTGTFSNNRVADGSVIEGKTTAEGRFILLQHGLYYKNETTPLDLRQHLHQESAFDLTPGCLLQIPQNNVKIRVKVELETDHLVGTEVDEIENDFTYERWLSLDTTSNEGDLFTWEPEKRYIYFLHIPNIHGHEIFLETCEVLPWDDVQSTDIPIEL